MSSCCVEVPRYLAKHSECHYLGPVSVSDKSLIVRSREVSKPWDLYLALSDRSEIWQAHRQHCCRCACQMSERCDNLNYHSRCSETSRDLTIRRLRILKQDTGHRDRDVTPNHWWYQKFRQKRVPRVISIVLAKDLELLWCAWTYANTVMGHVCIFVQLIL